MALLPKKPQGEPGLQAGALVVYENDGRPLVAAVLSYKNQKFQVLNQRGREAELPGTRLHSLPGALPADIDSTQTKTDYLSRLADSASAEAATLNLEDIWTFVVSEAREYETKELCVLYFGGDQLSSHLALHLALLGDRIFFKRRDLCFVPRPLDVVDDLKKSELSRIEKLRIHELLVATFKERRRDRQYPIPQELRAIIHSIEEVAAGVAELDNARLKDAKEIIDLCAEKLALDLQGSREARAYSLLEAVHLVDRNSNFAFIRHRYPIDYSPEVLKAAAALVVPSRVDELASNEREVRKDLTELACFTIDDAVTKDMDDALSIERTRDGFRLGIHISDVASLLPHDTLLDRDARSRATSLYAPDRIANMLPPALAEDKLSLRAGEVRPTQTCLVEIDRNFKILSTSVVLSLIKVRTRYTYDQVDHELEDPHSELNTVYNIASCCEAERIAHGALKMSKREIQVAVLPDGDISLTEIDESSPARSMIGEMMVLANTIFAKFGVEHSLPLIFRGQEGPEVEQNDESPTLPEGPAADYSARSKLKKSYTSVRPIRHASLALDAYIQATSPIRRYADLINQRQIAALILTGKPQYSPQKTAELLEELESPLALGQAISKASRRFWLLRALEKLSATTTVFHGTVLRTDLKNPLVELHELVMPVLVKVHHAVKPGDEIRIRLLKVDARSDYLRLESM